MTPQEIETQLKTLLAQEQARQNNWRKLRMAATFCAIVFVLGGFGFLVFSIANPGNGRQTLQTAMFFIMLSLPMSLLGAALR